ncbi:lipopolysaccharide-induced tumor necrosis factor-alpha factor homolog [Myripristis murdjan]|uniref:lipopolysaccharide-induced tumor necrosis factor-alpha factor homolog n=1 Tax=Myripristis murdjan TaxID=586833 RepID=UPI0011762143|nr:lipopolysaccharide-induced tumor necrosis factor-alpha factor homolog [Myripristis murdjan]XP_029915128.1 lipopolysaccharide-induced tumor necrosis factor-alpha factor homolog [Myripristis murdjan]
MDPPSYDEANLHPPALSPDALNIPPPPSYDASLASPPTPPPTYREAVTVQPDPFPVLAPPTVTTAVTSVPQQPGYIIHHSTQIGITETVQTRPAPTVVVVQPQAVSALGESPGVIQCPYCHQIVTTKVAYIPGRAAWCMCLLFTLTGLVCGCCLIPFMMHGVQDVHHSCPQCNNHLHIYAR